MDRFSEIIAKRTGLSASNVANTIKLFDEGATIPFISRYRKEMTGSMDEVQVGEVKEQLTKLRELEKRKETVLKAIEEQDKLTPELKKKIEDCDNLTDLEDIYLPYKVKKKTRATKAREAGLEPLAVIMMKQKEINIEGKAAEFINDTIPDVESALAGARDIIAEWVNENLRARNMLRSIFDRTAVIYSTIIKGKAAEAEKFQDYFEFSEPLKNCPSHRMLAIRRGEAEGFLKISIQPDEEKALEALKNIFVDGFYEISQQVEQAVEDSYKRLLLPSIENEYKALTKEAADIEAIKVFSENLRQLLLASPLGQKEVLAIDPGYRTGCKVVCLDKQGNLLHNETIYPHAPQEDKAGAKKKINSLVQQYKIEAIAIGNGTASRETEHFIRSIHFDRDLQVFVVSESGASIYSASKIAREEFPDYDVTVRGAVSIGRRLMDPLAELVKIDAKSIGVGQYQHDVDQTKLKTGLDTVVESCVNQVGVNVNTASKHLLTYISGLGPVLAQNIVDYRKENGAFKKRSELKKVARMGGKAFEQAAGFLRIEGAANPLDNSAVHPESYFIVEKMAKDHSCKIEDLIQSKDIRDKINIHAYVNESIGLPTLKDILNELAKPGRDPRTKIEVFEFSSDVYKIEDLKPGMELPGIVTNITNFGAFVDVGVKQDGLVHISQLADRFVKDPNEVVKLNQHVKVKVLEVDVSRKRIQLSMKG
ncbi:MAG: RNA-binding transcriptional accessory protein [Bacteroidales bacterium]|nr:RNA-binding transcriptional accessory protein [Bacteroidales bacterium]MCF8390859.1 RNA-binding transcriptional accessory protein [Bacteroidales bacterium]